jgi:hypothetical protein
MSATRPLPPYCPFLFNLSNPCRLVLSTRSLPDVLVELFLFLRNSANCVIALFAIVAIYTARTGVSQITFQAGRQFWSVLKSTIILIRNFSLESTLPFDSLAYSPLDITLEAIKGSSIHVNAKQIFDSRS